MCIEGEREREREKKNDNFIIKIQQQKKTNKSYLNPSCQQIHRSSRANAGWVISLQLVNTIYSCIQALFYSVDELMMNGVNVLGYLPGGQDVGRILQADATGMDAGGPPFVRILFDDLGRHGSDQRRVQATGQEDSERDLTHEMAFHRLHHFFSQHTDIQPAVTQ